MVSEHIVEGFYFKNKDAVKEAQKEAEGVHYVRTRTNMEEPEQVLRIYKKMIDQGMFQTQVGYAYLRELQDYLYTMPRISNEEVPPIPVADKIRVTDAGGTTRMLEKKIEAERHKRQKSVILNVILTIVVVLMFAIALSSNSTTILNYENQIIDKYTQWEQDLEAREKALEEKGL